MRYLKLLAPFFVLTACSSSQFEARLRHVEEQQVKIARTLGIEESAASPVAERVELPVEGSPSLGPVSAQKELVIFMDLECPFCAKYYQSAEELLELYPEDLQIVIKFFPLTFRGEAVRASKFLLAANELGEFEPALKLVLEDQKSLGLERYQAISQEIGIDWSEIQELLGREDRNFEKAIARDLRLGGKAGVKGTPTFFLNGELVNGSSMRSLVFAMESSLSRGNEG